MRFLQSPPLFLLFDNFSLTFAFQGSPHGRLFAFGTLVASVVVLSEALLVWKPPGKPLASAGSFVTLEALRGHRVGVKEGVGLTQTLAFLNSDAPTLVLS